MKAELAIHYSDQVINVCREHYNTRSHKTWIPKRTGIRSSDDD